MEGTPMKRRVKISLILLILMTVFLFSDVWSQSPASYIGEIIFKGPRYILKEWETCINVPKDLTGKRTSIIQLFFNEDNSGFLYVDGNRVATFPEVGELQNKNPLARRVLSYYGPLQAGKHIVKVEVKQPATLRNIRGYNGIRLCY